jgi:hypothetical protein
MFGFSAHLRQPMAMKGESLYKISTLMGNSPEIRRRHYAALSPETLAETAEFMQSSPKRINASVAQTL